MRSMASRVLSRVAEGGQADEALAARPEARAGVVVTTLASCNSRSKNSQLPWPSGALNHIYGESVPPVDLKPGGGQTLANDLGVVHVVGDELSHLLLALVGVHGPRRRAV